MNTHSPVRRRALPALLTLGVTATVSLAAPDGAVAQAAFDVNTRPVSISWGPCPQDSDPPGRPPSPKARCATVKVPLDWSKPKGEKIGLFVARYPAADPAKRIGVLMSNPGGPGAPGADDALYADDPYDGYDPAIRERFDMIGFDPRGVGRSEGARCDESILDKIPARPRTAAEFERLRTLNGRLAQSCLRRTGPLAAHMDGESVARDMDAIRAALGERRISFIGHSYGTFLGERYARLFPGRLRALALDSALDPDRPDAERYLKDGSVSVNRTFKRLAAWCAGSAACALKGQDLAAVTDELFARADAGTLREPGRTGPTRKKVDADQLSTFLSGELSGWNPKSTARRLAALHTGKGEVNWISGPGDLAARLVLCRDFDFRIRDYAHYRAIRARVSKAAPHVRHNSQSLDLVLGCQGWTVPPKPRPARAQGDLPPVLVVNATDDKATPLAGARRMARSFPNASLRTVNTVGHWMYSLPEPRRRIDAYLLGRTD
ncbi:alpha/beta hydrolase [Streptomyces spectabilis]|uniref:Alpha/beta fold hydrolase n=1 Tax=Streptomyces spectabilis TaxID=68270 RepID=A0A5P2XPM3_STRST|nr:alpha/beta hydrolase [Streptomyces spectabilis]MBB5100964.1 pimeloyl-ACP methyl ester carboxylesterase [Streptomyces spectabilis]MCI3900177.1 alpha/beta hydrolase [Streptomyces spectabilis]QEV64422.1 alpha/beta fold hydrolase [Streptomyces spectabilis]GGV08734.1 alpha/beta hydrolase [Streptomyces spectabilis]